MGTCGCGGGGALRLAGFPRQQHSTSHYRRDRHEWADPEAKVVITATRSITEPARMARVACTFAGFVASGGDPQLISELRDHKGELNVFWAIMPTSKAQGLIEEAWVAHGEPLVRHYTPDGKEATTDRSQNR